MTAPSFVILVLSVSLVGCASSRLTEKDLRPLDVQHLNDDTVEAEMTQDDLTGFFAQQRKDAPLRLALRNGKIVWGRFASYDEYYQTVWINPYESKGFLSRASYKVGAIRNAQMKEKEKEGFDVFKGEP